MYLYEGCLKSLLFLSVLKERKHSHIFLTYALIPTITPSHETQRHKTKQKTL